MRAARREKRDGENERIYEDERARARKGGVDDEGETYLRA
jgi:hypothetical protein